MTYVMRFFKCFILTLCFLVPALSHAQSNIALIGRDTGLELPRYASIKSNEVFVRVGPGQRYPIEYIYQRAGLPVKITKEFEGWRKVEDQRGNEGWVHNVLVSGAKTALVLENDTPLHRKPKESSHIIARLSKDVIVDVDKCIEGFCRVETQGFKGFAPQSAFWGIQ